MRLPAEHELLTMEDLTTRIATQTDELHPSRLSWIMKFQKAVDDGNLEPRWREGGLRDLGVPPEPGGFSGFFKSSDVGNFLMSLGYSVSYDLTAWEDLDYEWPKPSEEDRIAVARQLLSTGPCEPILARQWLVCKRWSARQAALLFCYLDPSGAAYSAQIEDDGSIIDCFLQLRRLDGLEISVGEWWLDRGKSFSPERGFSAEAFPTDHHKYIRNVTGRVRIFDHLMLRILQSNKPESPSEWIEWAQRQGIEVPWLRPANNSKTTQDIEALAASAKREFTDPLAIPKGGKKKLQGQFEWDKTRQRDAWEGAVKAGLIKSAHGPKKQS